MHRAWLDLLALFRGPPLDSHSIKVLPEQAKGVPISYLRPDGSVSPPGTKVIWPFVCAPRRP